MNLSLIDLLLPLIALGLAIGLLAPRISNAIGWRTTVTPLASIIGSGFLVIAPLLGNLVGSASTWAIIGIVLVAYAIGAVIRFNIRYAEPLIDTGNNSLLIATERLSNMILTVAYVISIAFYIRLLSAFLLKAFNQESELLANGLTTAILLLIGLVGWLRGLQGLELLEKWAVTIKISIIAAMLVGLANYDLIHGVNNTGIKSEPRTLFESMRMLAGILLVVQGFETSRYLGDSYTASARIRGMRFAQLLSAIIYISFVWLVTPILYLIPSTSLDETAIIDLLSNVAFVLPAMLVIAATMSQFSAAVADTLGAGGLLVEETNNTISIKTSYIVLVITAIGLVWISNIFEIITLASRAFALYYLAQVFVAMQTTKTLESSLTNIGRKIGFGLIAVALLWIVIFALPVG